MESIDEFNEEKRLDRLKEDLEKANPKGAMRIVFAELANISRYQRTQNHNSVLMKESIRKMSKVLYVVTGLIVAHIVLTTVPQYWPAIERLAPFLQLLLK